MTALVPGAKRLIIIGNPSVYQASNTAKSRYQGVMVRFFDFSIFAAAALPPWGQFAGPLSDLG
ncbi:MAG: hypothetical protein ACYDAI_11470 [Trichloromonadaceae bacterium]